MTKQVVNRTDRVETLDLDGNVVHVFQGDDWNDIFKIPEVATTTLKSEGAVRVKTVNRRGELRSITAL